MAHLNRQTNTPPVKKRRLQQSAQTMKRTTIIKREKRKMLLSKFILVFTLLMSCLFGIAIFLMNKQITNKMHKGIHQQVMTASENQIKGEKAVNHFEKVVEKYCTNDNGDDIKNQNLNVKTYRQAKKELTIAYDKMPEDYRTNFSNLESRILLMLQVQLTYNNYFTNTKKDTLRSAVTPAQVLSHNIEISSDLNTIIDQTNSDNPFVKRMIDCYSKLGDDANTINKTYNAVSSDLKKQPELQSDMVANNLYQQIVNNTGDDNTPDQIKDMVNQDLNGDNKEMYSYVYSKLNSPRDYEIAHCFIVKDNVTFNQIKNDAKVGKLNFKWRKQTIFLDKVANSKAIELECEFYQQQRAKKASEDSAKKAKEKASLDDNTINERRNKILANMQSQQQVQQNSQANNNNQQNNAQQNSQQNSQQNNNQNQAQQDSQDNQTQYDPDQLNPPDNDPTVKDPVLHGAPDIN